MKLHVIAVIAALAAAPAMAGGNHGNGGNPCGGNCGNGNGGAPAAPEGVFAGSAVSHSSGGSFAASGGIAFNGASGGSFVRNEQSAGQLAGAFAGFENGALTTETFVDGFSQSGTVTHNWGSGTIGAGAGFASTWGDADASGSFSRNW